MKRITDLCMKHDLKFELDFCIEEHGYFCFTASKWTDRTKNSFTMKCSLVEYQDSTCFDAFVDYFCIRVLEAFDLNTIEAILERAKVIWSDNMITRSRTIISKNQFAPLTEEEKAMIKRMWEAQGLILEVVFINEQNRN